MRKVLAVLLLIFALSFSAFGGHTVGGNYACTCNTPGCIEDYSGECNGYGATQQGATPNDGTAEIGIVIIALLLLLRMKP